MGSSFLLSTVVSHFSVLCLFVCHFPSVPFRLTFRGTHFFLSREKSSHLRAEGEGIGESPVRLAGSSPIDMISMIEFRADRLGRIEGKVRSLQNLEARDKCDLPPRLNLTPSIPFLTPRSN
jgi:hypothetical protein